MQNAAQADAHVQTFLVASEVMEYHNCLAVAASEDSDFGDQCYYSDQADYALDRLRQMGAADVAFALTYRPRAPRA